MEKYSIDKLVEKIIELIVQNERSCFLLQEDIEFESCTIHVKGCAVKSFDPDRITLDVYECHVQYEVLTYYFTIQEMYDLEEKINKN